ncbi:hypothetical protein ABTN15_19535, partial [Acinetobacter baumannii]
KIHKDWVTRPITLTLAGVQTGVQDLKERTGVLDDAQKLMALRDRLEAEEERIAKERFERTRSAWSDEPPERLTVPAAEFRKWFEAEGA